MYLITQLMYLPLTTPLSVCTAAPSISLRANADFYGWLRHFKINIYDSAGYTYSVDFTFEFQRLTGLYTDNSFNFKFH